MTTTRKRESDHYIPDTARPIPQSYDAIKICIEMANRSPSSLRLRMTVGLVTAVCPVTLTAVYGFQQVNELGAAISADKLLVLFAMCAVAGVAGPFLVWSTFLFPVCRRISQAALAAQQLADGTYSQSADACGNDELSQLRQDIHRAALSSVEDLEKRERDQQSLSHQATHDELTGLSNRKFGNETIARLEQSNDGGPISILFLDLDGFKAVNDTCGHAIGDEILVAVSLRLKAILHKDTVLIRWGGDEFVIVLPGADSRGAISVAQDVADLFKRPYATSEGVHKLGCSIGIATSRPDTSLDTVLQEADASMYDQKKKRKENTRRPETDKAQDSSANGLRLHKAA